MFSQRCVRIGDGTLQRATIHATTIAPSSVEGGATLVPLEYGKRTRASLQDAPVVAHNDCQVLKYGQQSCVQDEQPRKRLEPV